MKYAVIFLIGMGQGMIVLDWFKARSEAKKFRKYAPVKQIKVVG
jgi:hypothetical protein